MKNNIHSEGIANYTNSFIEANDSELSLVHYALTDEINLGNQKFNLNGYKDDYAPKRPKVLFNHGLDGLWFAEETDPRISFLYMLGRNEWTVVTNNSLKEKTVFNKSNELAVDLYHAYKNGDWTDWSVRWAFTQTDGKIDKNAFEEKDNILYVNSFWTPEYSAVFMGKDTGAVTDLMSHLNDYKSDIFKNHVSKIHLTSQVQNSDEVETLKTEIAELKSTIENTPDDKVQDILKEANEYTNGAIKKYAELLKPKLLDITNNINDSNKIILNNDTILSTMRKELRLIVKEEITGVISEQLGRV